MINYIKIANLNNFQSVTNSNFIKKQIIDKSIIEKLNNFIITECDQITSTRGNKSKSKTLTLVLEYLNEDRMRLRSKMHPNSSISCYLLYLTEKMLINIDRFTDIQIKSELSLFINKFTKLIIVSLMKQDPDLIKRLIILLMPETSNDPSQLEGIAHQIRLNTINTSSSVLILKELLHHLNICMSNEKFENYTLDNETIKIIIKESKIDLSKMMGLRKVQKNDLYNISVEITTDINDLINNYNKLCNLIFKSTGSVVLILFKWLSSLLYSHRGILVTSNKVDNLILSKVLSSVKGEGITNLEPEKVSEFLPDLDLIIDQILENTSIPTLETNDIFQHKSLHITSSSGPNGGPAMLTMPSDSKALLKDPELLDLIVQLGELFKITNIKESVINLAGYELDIEHKESESISQLTHSKLFIFPEPGGKWRVVAELDSFSQTVLNPIHDVLTNMSKSMEPISAHFDQDKSFHYIYELSQNTGFLGTFDLRNATDYLYLNLLKTVVDRVILKAYNISDVGDL